ncbi:hypothetical protein UCDDS831_g02140 [Diplodia seriata]|uniref:Uncharacterized protein n=1 Tax=Diplodia seriata TaxID=420778 RepID=A0A0G2GPD4_9PEZI|nr:hypothetical protein UCDDS831_g02140 [Diplodia seriata]
MMKDGGLVIGICFGIVAFCLALLCFFTWLRSSEEVVEVQAVLDGLELEGMAQEHQQRLQSLHERGVIPHEAE